MTMRNFFKDIMAGNFSNAEKRAEDYVKELLTGISTSFKESLHVLTSPDGKELQTLVGIFAKDVIGGGFTTASFIQAAKDIGGELLTKGITLPQTTVFAALNTEVTQQAADAGLTVPAFGAETQIALAVPADDQPKTA